MYATGHYGAALLVYAPVAFVLVRTDPLLAVVGGGVVLSLATLPDVDMRIPLVPHRGPTHSLVFLVCVATVLAGAGYALGQGSWQPIGGPFRGAAFGALFGVVGVGSHLLADALTPMGVNVWWPVPTDRFSLDVARADNTLANYGLLFLGSVACVLALLVAGRL
jgi:inner membrane protein